MIQADLSIWLLDQLIEMAQVVLKKNTSQIIILRSFTEKRMKCQKNLQLCSIQKCFKLTKNSQRISGY